MVLEPWLFGVGILTSIASIILCRILIVIAPKDAPDSERKSQQEAVPSSGGIAFGTISLGWIVYLFLISNGLSSLCSSTECQDDATSILRTVWPHLGLFLGVLFLGAADDIFTLPAKPKLAILTLLALSACFFGDHVPSLFLPVADSYLPIATWLGVLGSALWVFVMMNATNFMDGSNGLALGTLAIMLGAICFKFIDQTYQGHFDSIQFIASIFASLVVFAIIGFLFWNLQGKLYAGDAGSLFGGAVFASLGIYAAQDGNIWFPATLALPFLVDVFMTLLWRARAGHNLLTPHRHHAYQLLIKSGWSHIKTALLWWGLATLCATAALWAASHSKSMSAWVFIALLMGGIILWIGQRVSLKHVV